jgi:hypothetical protein
MSHRGDLPWRSLDKGVWLLLHGSKRRGKTTQGVAQLNDGVHGDDRAATLPGKWARRQGKIVPQVHLLCDISYPESLSTREREIGLTFSTINFGG